MKGVPRPHPVQWASQRRHRLLLERYKRQGLVVGENFVCYPPLYISDPPFVRIGNNVRIASHVHFIAHDAAGEHLALIGVSDVATTWDPIIVHDDSGIGYGTIILPGVSIGPRSIVGAGSVVRSDVPPDTVVAGNPARVASSIPDLAERLRASRSESVWFVRALLARRWPGRFPLERLSDDTRLDSAGLGLDSVEIVEVVLECEERYGVRLAEELLASAPLTIRSLAEHLTPAEAAPSGDVAAQQRRS